MSNLVANGISKFFENSAFPLLFTGAGVSAHAGLPTWSQLVDRLAEGIRAYDPLTTQHMLEYANEGNFPVSFEYFKISRKMLEGEKQKLLVRLLSDFNVGAIAPLVKLPFRGCLTTNFDRSILDAIARERAQAARDFRFGDVSFKNAQWEESLFVARIHGSVEMPDSMVLSDSQFAHLLNDETYADLLRACFLHRSILFLGFSFYDPAVRHVFEQLNKRFGPAAPGRHMALLPSGTDSEFIQKANRLNIEVVHYDSSDDHAALWDGIRIFGSRPSSPMAPRSQSTESPFEFTKRYLAACYARARTKDSSAALREALGEGIVSALLQEVAPKAIRRIDLLEKMRLSLGLKGTEAASIVDAATKALQESGLCRRQKDSHGRKTLLVWTGSTAETSSLESAIEVLTKSLANRAYLQEGWKPGPEFSDTVSVFFNHLIRRRGWDLGAAFATGRAPVGVAIESLLRECTTELPAFDRERLLRVCQSMFQHPTEEEAAVLGELGRISFAVELAFQSPRTVLLHNTILPRTIYFDASVLLPALVDGHPFSSVYTDAITALRAAATSAAIDLRCRVCTVYLNEIISHRNNAVAYSNEFGSDFHVYAQTDAMFTGVTNINVFVGAYANSAASHDAVPFKDFLASVAPYETEPQLKLWLTRKGFDVIDSMKGPQFPPLYAVLEKAYADGLSRGKGPLLISHDATQLSMLASELDKGEKALFVTADRRLQIAVADSKYSSIAGMMMSHVGLVQFIELAIGGTFDSAGLTELLWSSRISDRAMAVRSYLTNRALEQYDAGMAMALPKIVEKFADEAVVELERTGADLDTDEPTKRADAFRKLGSLERTYFSNMEVAVNKLRAAVEGPAVDRRN